eukprot:TRINITY_DN3832_c0_g1_i1.p1 TRINITY_DN3832_c0_g1~~TRINITY_DN3832_c0_g1_i1.p1  ORF type:complete len:725 (-),score=151.41 TRINITY_DN3832_c0_g1_i1:440-2614(-)
MQMQLARRFAVAAVLFLIFMYLQFRKVPHEHSLQPVIYLNNPHNNAPIVAHVTKESPLALYGGLGQFITGLTHAQLAKTELDIHVIMPYYRFLEDNEDRFARTERLMRISFTYNRAIVDVEVFQLKEDRITYILIAAGNEAPFDGLFFANEINEIYKVNSNQLSTLERDIVFGICAAKVITQLALTQPISYVHLHGATNALVAPLLHQYSGSDLRPTITYTIHDYNGEQFYQVPVSMLQLFGIRVDGISQETLAFTNVAILYSDIITCVSRSMAADIASGLIQFPLQNLLQQRYAEGSLIGINNAVSGEDAPALQRDDWLNRAGCRFRKGESADAKRCSRGVLVSEQLLHTAGMEPVVLFVGRFEQNKGLYFLPAVAEASCASGFHFAMMGRHTSVESRSIINKMRAKAIEQHCSITIVDTQEEQDEYGKLLRAAADFTFVPSLREAFGLVAAEALAYGSIPIVSNVGGLRDIVEAASPEKSPLGYLFEVIEQDIQATNSNILRTISEAVTMFHQLSSDAHSALVETLTQRVPSWDDTGGPAELYLDAYRTGEQRRQNVPSREVSIAGLPRSATLFVALKNIFSVANLQASSVGCSVSYAEDAYMLEVKPSGDRSKAVCTFTFDVRDHTARGNGITAVHLSGWSKATDVQPRSLTASYALQVDVGFIDGTHSTIKAPFSYGTHEWEYAAAVVAVTKNSRSITVHAQLASVTGAAEFAEFDNFFM